jgi:3',5'-cyclic AMP phosphodiesterase CpdA
LTIRLAHLSDPHFGCENGDAVEAVVAAVTTFVPDLTIISGDLTSGGRTHEFEAARAWLARLPQPLIITPGNHDVPYWNLPLRLFAPFVRYSRYLEQALETAVDLPGLAVRSLNTARGAQPRLDWSKGAINLAAVRQAAAELGAAPRALKVLVCHHPLVEMRNAVVSGGVHRGSAAAGILAGAGVDLVLTGHVHNPFAFKIRFPEEPCYAIGAGTLSLRTRGTPAGFSIIVADAETVRMTALGWTGANFEPVMRWSAPRHGSAQAGADRCELQIGASSKNSAVT